MWAADPQVSSFRCRNRRNRRNFIFGEIRFEGESVDFFGVEAGERQVEIRDVEIGQLEGQQFLVPVSPRH